MDVSAQHRVRRTIVTFNTKEDCKTADGNMMG